MKYILSVIFCVVLTSLLVSASAQTVQSWLTNSDKSVLFEQQSTKALSAFTNPDGLPVITVNSGKKYQSIDGFGFALTGGSASHLLNMAPNARKAILNELFGTDKNNIGISYLRISIGASDLNDHVYSYNDLPDGATDINLEKFDLGADKTVVIPVLKEILAINPSIKILSSPWSAPKWMKTNNDTKGGSLKPEYYDVYARYFVRYIQEMKKAGIHIDAITVQNEPLHPGNNPSMYMPANEQCEFVKKHLGPAFQKVAIDTKIIIYDHNANRPDYPISILNDPEAKKFVDGSAFHLYEGKIEALTTVHEAHPDKNLYFTEQWVGFPSNFAQDLSEHINNLIIGATRNWCRNVIEWNLSSDAQLQPHTDRGGCDRCLGGITIDGNKVTRNAGYYVIAHAAKFVRPGSVRIDSDITAGLNNVAFLTPKGEIVLVVINNNDEKEQFVIKEQHQSFTTTLNPGSVATYIWE